VTAKRLKDELNQISRKSNDEELAVAGLHNVYTGLSQCCDELENSLHQSAADFERLFTPDVVSDQFISVIFDRDSITMLVFSHQVLQASKIYSTRPTLIF